MFLYMYRVRQQFTSFLEHFSKMNLSTKKLYSWNKKKVEDKCFSYLNIQLGLLFFDHFLKSRMDGLAGADYIVP